MEGSPFMCSGNSTSIFFQTTATTRPRTGEESYCEYSNTKKTPYSYKPAPTSFRMSSSQFRVLIICLSNFRLSFKSNWGWHWFFFILLRAKQAVIGPENSRHSLNQSHAKLTPVTTWSLVPLVPLVLFFSLCWLLSFLLTGHYGYFSFVFKTLNPKVLYEQVT